MRRKKNEKKEKNTRSVFISYYQYSRRRRWKNKIKKESSATRKR